MPVTVTGLGKTRRKFGKLVEVSAPAAGGAIMIVAAIVRDEAKRDVKKDTHKLEKSIAIGPFERRGHKFWVKVGPTKKGWYGRFIEFGTRFIAAGPFLRPARDRNTGTLKARTRIAMREAIKKAKQAQ